MKFLKWLNDSVGEYDIFMIANKNEAQRIVQYFDTSLALSCASFTDSGEEYYYFLNTRLKKITPMTHLAFAFGGMYNGYTPYGEELDNFDFKLEEYILSGTKEL